MKTYTFSKRILISLIIIVLLFPLLITAESENLQLRDLSIKGVETKDLEADKYLGWQGTLTKFKENVNLLLTFNTFKKAEKKLIYAENRLRVGQNLLQKDDNKSQEKGVKIISQADSYKYDIFLNNEDNLSNLWESGDDKMEQLIKDLSVHQVNKAIVWSQAEKIVPVSSLSNLSLLRNKVEAKDLNIIDKLQKSLDNVEGTEDLSLELDKAVMVIDTFKTSRENFVSVNENLLKKINNYQDKEIETFLKEGLNNLEVERQEVYNKVKDYNLNDIQQLKIKAELRSQINKITPSQSTSTESTPTLPTKNHLDNFKNTPEYQKFLSNIDSSRQIIEEDNK